MNRSTGGSIRPGRASAVHVLLAAAILALAMMPVGLAQSAPEAGKSLDVSKQLKKLRTRVAALEDRPIATTPTGITGGQIADGSLTGADVMDDGLGGPDVLESSVLIPRAWAKVTDPAGNAPAGDPFADAQEGISVINDGDDGAGGSLSGVQCYELGFTPDLVLSNLTITSPRVFVKAVVPGAGGCGVGAGYDVGLQIEDPAGNLSDSDLYVAFFDL